MEARISGQTHPFFGPGPSELNGFRNKTVEWDLNEWKWDGDQFVATPLHNITSDCRSKQPFPVIANGGSSNSSSSGSDDTGHKMDGKEKGELEKRRRIVLVEEDEPDGEAGNLALKLGGAVYPIAEEVDITNLDKNNSKNNKERQPANSSRGMCQVEGCGFDLSDAKDYHRRHKVCEMHAKASEALVGNVMQRFCQQCSRFHLLQEFDEGKRSCRRRLAGHNKRRRKTHSHASESALTDDHASSYLLISLLRILSNLQSNNSGPSKDQGLVAHLLRNLASLAGSFDAQKLSALLQASQDLQKTESSVRISPEAAQDSHFNGDTAREISQPSRGSPNFRHGTEGLENGTHNTHEIVIDTIPAVENPSMINSDRHPLGENMEFILYQRSSSIAARQDCCPSGAGASISVPQTVPRESSENRIDSKKVRMKSFDLNDAYSDGQDAIGETTKIETSENVGIGPLKRPSWMLQECHNWSPPQKSGNSDVLSAQSPSNSNGDVQNRTDRIVFKLFGKDPNDFPTFLRAQMANWLSNTPTDIESYIRPGCIILTVYLRLPESMWEEISCNLGSSLKKLLDIDGGFFWRTGWVYVRVQNQMAFIDNGHVVLDKPLLLSSHNHCNIFSITPIAVSVLERVNFRIKGCNLAQPSTRLLCAFEGQYLVQDSTLAFIENSDTVNLNDRVQCLSFSCSIPKATGRGFVEVEDYGLSSSFFPFIVADPDMCAEIRTLEDTIKACYDSKFDDGSSEMKARIEAMNFLNEMGWLLRRCHLNSRVEDRNSCPSTFSVARFKWLMEFSMAHDWRAVVKKLLDILVEGDVELGGQSTEHILAEMALLHRAVQNNSKTMVALLLRYVPGKSMTKRGVKGLKEVRTHPETFLFRPDMPGPFDMTPLHIAANRGEAESVLDALTNDPGQVGISAWKTVHDSTGFTPADYAKAKGYESYLHLVERKINSKFGSGHVVLDIPGALTDRGNTGRQAGKPRSSKVAGFQIEDDKLSAQMQCGMCSQQQLAYRMRIGSSLLYRPAMLSLVGIAAVCVCVGLLLKGPPEVLFVFPPFRWELLDYGPM